MIEGTELTDRYRLESRLTAGPGGEIWQAHDTVLGRRVAVRIADPGAGRDREEAERFRARATLAGSLTHRHTVTIYDIGEVDRRPFLVTELIDGVDLPRLLAEGPLAPPLVALIGRDIAGALSGAHDRGLAHGHLHPGSVLLSVAGEAKLVGLGLPGLDGSSSAWAPPERRNGERGRGGGADPRGDVYSLGLVLHACLTGWHPPAGGSSPGEVPDPAPHRPDAPPPLVGLIRRATDADPSARVPDATELAADLDALVPADARDRLAAAVRPIAAARRRATASPRPGSGPSVRRSAGAAGGSPGDQHPTREIEQPPRARPPSRTDTATLGVADATPWWRRHAPGLAAGLLVLALLVGGAVRWSEGPSSPRGADTPGATTTEDASPGSADVTATGALDPFGDGREHSAETARVIDGDPATAWTTEQYNTADLGGLKPGVGLWVELSETPGRIQLQIPGGPVDLEVHVGADAPEAAGPDSWGQRVDALQGVSGEVTVEVPPEVDGRYVVVWFTHLAPVEGRFAARLAEVRVEPAG